jgi:hypothetical protein
MLKVVVVDLTAQLLEHRTPEMVVADRLIQVMVVLVLVVAALVLLFFATKARHKEQAARSLKMVSGTSTRLRHLGVLLHRPVAAVALARRRRPYKSWSPVVVAEAAGRIEAAGRRTVAVVAEAAVSTAPSS